MKHKTTKKAMKENYRKIIYVGYAELQQLLKCTEPIAYTAGVYGWNADIYTIDGVAIVTGYRPFGNIKPDYDMVHKYDMTARDIIHNGTDYVEIKEKLDNLINEFIEEVTR